MNQLINQYQLPYWREYSPTTPTFFSHEICPEMGGGLYTGAGSDMKLPI